LENIDVSDGGLEHAIYQAKTLDLFAGTGNLGLEALSRGAQSAVFVDKSQASLSVIRENINTAKMSHLSEVIKGDVFAVLDRLKKENRSFNLVFADPPYEKGFAAEVVESFDDGALLEIGAIIVVEHSKGETIDFAALKKLSLIRSKQYGQTVVNFLMKY
jgi:16S rRNA (guanine(966)-N(2))-methyltransferase RsmD